MSDFRTHDTEKNCREVSDSDLTPKKVFDPEKEKILQLLDDSVLCFEQIIR